MTTHHRIPQHGFTTVFCLLFGALASITAQETGAGPEWLFERSELEPSIQINEVAYGKETFLVPVVQDSWEGTVGLSYSNDGSSWKNCSEYSDEIPVFKGAIKLRFLPTVGRFIASDHETIRYSSNGFAWYEATLPENFHDGSSPLYLELVNHDQLLVAWSSENGRLFVSEDGINWSQMADLEVPVSELTFNAMTNRWYATSWLTKKVYKSIDGQHWDVVLDGYHNLYTLWDVSVFVEIEPSGISALKRTLITQDDVTYSETDTVLFGTQFVSSDTSVRYHTSFIEGTFYRFSETSNLETGDVSTILESSTDLVNWRTESLPTPLSGSVGKLQKIQSRYSDGGSRFYAPMVLGKRLVKSFDRYGQAYSEDWEVRPSYVSSFSSTLDAVAFASGRIMNSDFIGIKDEQVFHSGSGFYWNPIYQFSNPLVDAAFLPSLDRFVVFEKASNQQFRALTWKKGSNWEVLAEAIPFEPFGISGNGDVILINGIRKAEVLLSVDGGASWTGTLNGIEWHVPKYALANEWDTDFFERSILTVKNLKDVFILIWDDKIYRSTNGTDWSLTFDAQSESAWFSYLDVFNGHFIATSMTHYVTSYTLSYHITPRWEGSEDQNLLWYSEDGVEWKTTGQDLDRSFVTLPAYYKEDPVRWLHVNMGDGSRMPYIRETPGGGRYFIDENFQVSLATANERGSQYNSPGRMTFGKGRYLNLFWKNGETVVVNSEFAGFGSGKPSGAVEGYKNTGWFGHLDDSEFPLLHHELLGDVYFQLNSNDDIMLFSSRFGVLRNSRDGVPYFWNELDGKRYLLHFNPQAKNRIYDQNRQEWVEQMEAETLDDDVWFRYMDRLVDNIQQFARIGLLEQDYYAISIAYGHHFIYEGYEALEAYISVLRERFSAKYPSIESIFADKLEAANDAIEALEAVYYKK